MLSRTARAIVADVADAAELEAIPARVLEVLAIVAEDAGLEVDRDALLAGTVKAGAYAITLADRLRAALDAQPMTAPSGAEGDRT